MINIIKEVTLTKFLTSKQMLNIVWTYGYKGCIGALLIHKIQCIIWSKFINNLHRDYNKNNKKNYLNCKLNMHKSGSEVI